MSAHYEILSATKYYGRRSPGTVVLRNGHVAFHGSPSDAKAFLAACKGGAA